MLPWIGILPEIRFQYPGLYYRTVKSSTKQAVKGSFSAPSVRLFLQTDLLRKRAAFAAHPQKGIGGEFKDRAGAI